MEILVGMFFLEYLFAKRYEQIAFLHVLFASAKRKGCFAFGA